MTGKTLIVRGLVEEYPGPHPDHGRSPAPDQGPARHESARQLTGPALDYKALRYRPMPDPIDDGIP